MAEITAGLVMKLRKMSGQGMMDCKKALLETGGDMDKAMTLLRKCPPCEKSWLINQ